MEMSQKKWSMSKNGLAGPILATKSSPAGPILVAKSGLAGPILVTKSGLTRLKMVWCHKLTTDMYCQVSHAFALTYSYVATHTSIDYIRVRVYIIQHGNYLVTLLHILS